MAAATLLPTGAVASAASSSHAVPTRQVPKGAHPDPSIARGHVDAGEPGSARSAAFPTRGPVTVMLQLDTRAAAQAFASTKSHGTTTEAVAAARTQRQVVAQVAASVRSHLSAAATKATPLFTLRNVYAGIAVRTDASRIGALGNIPGVLAVRPMPVKHLLNASSVPLIGAPQQWASGDNTGRGVRIGIIDTGIDYTHADFGGTGSRFAYDSDHRYADSRTLNVPSGDFPSDKVVGGYDFVGDGYDASSPKASIATPHPDPNPLDCNSHGSHVAGTAAGYGVNTNGSTFSGDYSTLANDDAATYQSRFRIGPGVAPQADLYALKVFGCEGSTNVVSEALDWAADPNGDGNFNDHLDVVNMSLGSDYGTPDDPDSVASNNASLIGITVVAAAGNGGDLQDVAGSPGNASRVIGVAASQDAMTIYDAMQENTPDSQKIAGQRSVLFDWADSAPVTGDVAAVNPTWQPGDAFDAGNANGCKAFTAAQAARVKGKIAWEEWTDDDAIRGDCGSLKVAGNAEAAGAIGVILTDDENTFAAGINGAEHIPTFQIRKVDSDALRAAAEGGTLNVTLTYDLRNSIKIDDPNAVDQIADFSSRGIRNNNNMKPDITAPGFTIFSTAMGTGNEGMNDNGTSMATPHITGAAALVKAAHPTWFPEQIKAALMDTASNSVFATPADNRNASTDRESPNRVGAGRVDVNRAASDDVLAYSFNTNGAVSISYGRVRATHDLTATRLFKVENNSDSDQTYDLAFRYANTGTQPAGVSFSFPSTVTVPAHSSSTVALDLKVDASALDHAFDTARGADFSEWVTEASGWLRLLQNGTEQLRLPVYAAPVPASAMKAASSSLTFPAGKDKRELSLTGKGVQQDGYVSQVSGYVLGATSGAKPNCTARSTDLSRCVLFPSDKAADLHYVGAASDSDRLRNSGGKVADGGTYFAVATYGDWRTPASYAEFDVNIDTNGDGQPDVILFNGRLTGTDIFASELYDVSQGEVVDSWLINRPMGDNGVEDTNPFDTRVIVLPVNTGELAQYAKSGAISYWVESYSAETGLADTTGMVRFNFLHPTLTVVNGPRLSSGLGSYQFFKDLPSGHGVTTLKVRRDLTSGNPRNSKLLLIHNMNAEGKTQLVSISG